VEQRDPAVPQVVRREGRDSSSGAGASHRCSEPVTPEALEDAAVGDAVVARHELADGLEKDRRDSDPTRASRLRDGARDAPAQPLFVEVAPGEPLEFAEAHTRRVED
jgi:hypothetical protein